MESADQIEDAEESLRDRRHKQFADITDIAANRFDEKNTKYRDAFVEGNETLKDAFESVAASYGEVSALVRMSDVSFDKNIAKRKLTDLLIYSALMMIWIDERR